MERLIIISQNLIEFLSKRFRVVAENLSPVNRYAGEVLLNGQALQVFESQPLPARDPKGIGGKMGEIVDISTEGFTVVCADGRIKVLRVKPADGPKCAAGEFATNAKLNLGTRLS